MRPRERGWNTFCNACFERPSDPLACVLGLSSCHVQSLGKIWLLVSGNETGSERQPDYVLIMHQRSYKGFFFIPFEQIVFLVNFFVCVFTKRRGGWFFRKGLRVLKALKKRVLMIWGWLLWLNRGLEGDRWANVTRVKKWSSKIKWKKIYKLDFGEWGTFLRP